MGSAVKLHFVAKYNGAHISKLAKSSLHRFFLSILKQKSLPSQRIWPEYNRFQQQYKSKHTVADYANFLCMAPKTITYKFNRLRLPQPNEVIKNRIILEAKRFLVHTSLTAKEIAHDLGYNDPAYFSRLFQTKTVESPSGFRANFLA
jgi:AraC-like DNA-binding protein